MTSFLYFPKSQAEKNAWYFHCQKRSQAYIVITSCGNHFAIEWDCTTIDPRIDEPVKGSALIRDLFATYRRMITTGSSGSLFEGSALHGSIEKLSKTDALNIAARFSAMFDESVSSAASVA